MRRYVPGRTAVAQSETRSWSLAATGITHRGLGSRKNLDGNGNCSGSINITSSSSGTPQLRRCLSRR